MTRRGLKPSPLCAAARCQTPARRGELMCRAHWLSLPQRLRTTILEAWQARQMREYGMAVYAAIELIAEREGVYANIFGEALETQPRQKTGDGLATPSPVDLIFPEFGGVAI
jgi:hypothetical protein